MTPVLRDCDNMSLSDIEKAIKDLAGKGRDGKLTVDELTGGNFTITNGGVFGSLMSTPIINPPQSAILGMHKIQDRPMAVNWQGRDPADDVPGTFLRSPSHRRTRIGRLPGLRQGVAWKIQPVCCWTSKPVAPGKGFAPRAGVLPGV